MFTFRKTKKAVCKIKGGRLNGKIIYLKDDEGRKSDSGSDSDNDDYKKSKCFKELDIHDGILLQLPHHKDRDCLYITGPSGAGKSTYASVYAKQYKRKKPKNDIILFSAKDEDPVLDRLNPLRIRLNEENLIDEETKLIPQDLENTLCIIDDIEAIPEKDLRDAMRDLRDQLLLIGRSMKITVICTNHLTTDNSRTRVPILESQFFTFFPAGGSNSGVMRYLKNYCGFTNKQANNLLSQRSRHVTIHGHYPRYCITKDKLFLL